ncbi:hypothetical protein BH10BAC6_BH10BAC6_12380 [soil metagenome]
MLADKTFKSYDLPFPSMLSYLPLLQDHIHVRIRELSKRWSNNHFGAPQRSTFRMTVHYRFCLHDLAPLRTQLIPYTTLRTVSTVSLAKQSLQF